MDTLAASQMQAMAPLRRGSCLQVHIEYAIDYHKLAIKSNIETVENLPKIMVLVVAGIDVTVQSPAPQAFLTKFPVAG